MYYVLYVFCYSYHHLSSLARDHKSTLLNNTSTLLMEVGKSESVTDLSLGMALYIPKNLTNLSCVIILDCSKLNFKKLQSWLLMSERQGSNTTSPSFLRSAWNSPDMDVGTWRCVCECWNRTSVVHTSWAVVNSNADWMFGNSKLTLAVGTPNKSWLVQWFNGAWRIILNSSKAKMGRVAQHRTPGHMYFCLWKTYFLIYHAFIFEWNGIDSCWPMKLQLNSSIPMSSVLKNLGFQVSQVTHMVQKSAFCGLVLEVLLMDFETSFPSQTPQFPINFPWCFLIKYQISK